MLLPGQVEGLFISTDNHVERNVESESKTQTQTHLFKQDCRKSINTYLSCAPVRKRKGYKYTVYRKKNHELFFECQRIYMHPHVLPYLSKSEDLLPNRSEKTWKSWLVMTFFAFLRFLYSFPLGRRQASKTQRSALTLKCRSTVRRGFGGDERITTASAHQYWHCGGWSTNAYSAKGFTIGATRHRQNVSMVWLLVKVKLPEVHAAPVTSWTSKNERASDYFRDPPRERGFENDPGETTTAMMKPVRTRLIFAQCFSEPPWSRRSSSLQPVRTPKSINRIVLT